MSAAATHWLAAALLFSAAGAHAQEIRLDGLRPAAPASSHVSALTDSATVRAGKADVIDLRFHIDPGYHINSHTPSDELMIPTALKLEPVSGVDTRILEYPAGQPFTLNLSGAKEQLSVYQSDFRVTVEVKAARPGTQTLAGVLRYQACDGAQCFPARTLPVKVLVTAR